MNVAAQPNMHRRVGEPVRPRCKAFVLALALVTIGFTAAPEAEEEAETGSPNVAVDPRTGREIYVPTGETIDLVVPVTAPRLVPADEPLPRAWGTVLLGLLAVPGLLLVVWFAARTLLRRRDRGRASTRFGVPMR